MISGDHIENRNAFPFEELKKYEGQYVAWSGDGKRILAGDTNPLRLATKLKEAGYSAEDFVVSFVDFETYLGGVMVGDDSEEGLSK
jgi:hypothetical protein